MTGVNLTGVFLTMRAAARRMSPRGYSKIVVTGSLYSVTGDSFFGAYGYAAAKGGVLSLVRTAATSSRRRHPRQRDAAQVHSHRHRRQPHALEEPAAVELRRTLWSESRSAGSASR